MSTPAALAPQPFPQPPSHLHFEPSEAQRRLLHRIYESGSIGTVDSLCHHAGVSRATYYRWCQNPAFRQWFAAAWSSRLIVDGATLLGLARANAHRSYPHWKALFDLTFSPKGLAQLHHWQQTCAAVASNAFDVPGLEPDPEEPPPAAPTPVSRPLSSQPQQNQHPGPGGETKPPRLSVPLPMNHRVYRGPDCSAGGPPSTAVRPVYPHHLARLLTSCSAKGARTTPGRMPPKGRQPTADCSTQS